MTAVKGTKCCLKIVDTYRDAESSAFQVPAGVSIVGDASNTLQPTILTGAGGNDFGLTFRHGVSVSHLRISNFHSTTGISSCIRDSSDGDPAIDLALFDVLLDSCDRGLELRYGNASIGQISVFDVQEGIYIGPDPSLPVPKIYLRGSLVRGNVNSGVTIYPSPGLNLDFTENIVEAASGLTILSGAHANVYIWGSTIEGHMDVNDPSGGYALSIYDADTTLDLGHAGSFGTNGVNGDVISLYDARPDRAAADGHVITLYGTHMDGESFPGVSAMGPVDNSPYWKILGKNNRIAF